MNEYITLTNTPELDLVESYTNEFNYIQEGKILDAAVGKDKQESIILKILLFLPRLLYHTAKFILTKLANTELGSKIKFLQRWCETPDNTNESYVIEAKFDTTGPWNYRYTYDKTVNVGSFKKINELSVTLVNLCDSMPESVDTLVKLSLTITDVMDRAYNDAKQNGVIDLVEQERRNDAKKRIKSYVSNGIDTSGLTDAQKEDLIRKRVNDMKFKQPSGTLRTTSNYTNPLKADSMKIFGGYANPFDPKWEKYFLAANVKPYDVQRECAKIEKIIAEHTIKVSKLYDEFNRVIPTVNKDNLKVSKSHVMALNPNKKDISDALKYINDIRRNMLYSAKRLDICAKRLDQMNPKRYRNQMMDVSYLIKDYRMMYTDCNKLSSISKIVVNHLVDTIDTIIEITGNSENVIQQRAKLHVSDDDELRFNRMKKLRDRSDQIDKSLKYTFHKPTEKKLLDEQDRIRSIMRKHALKNVNHRESRYADQIRNSGDPYGTNRLRDELD
jgi:hypothetical protein